jgi:putative endopeptidase
VERHFGGDAKPRALRVVEQVKEALRERLEEVDWMSDSTRAAAMLKMDAFKVKIGYPDAWIDYGGMVVTRGVHFRNMLSAHSFHFARQLAFVNAPTDKSRWFMTPQTINAYYHPSLNEIVFPAAILQAPFFNPAADDAVNFGAMGAGTCLPAGLPTHPLTHLPACQPRRRRRG